MRVGLFELVDPPDGQPEAIRAVLDACDYPFQRLIPFLRRDPDQAVIVRWVKTQHHGVYIDRTVEIHLTTQYTTWERSMPFTFAHELGHLVDFATFGDDEKADLLDLMHEQDDSRYAGQSDPNDPSKPHPWSHAREHTERWPSVQPEYLFRPRESYADLFVAAFVPSLWEGRRPRFVHWTDDLQAVRDLTLRRPIVPFTDVDGTTHQDAIEWAAGEGLLDGFTDGTFRPGDPVTRGQLATVLRKHHERNIA